MVYNKQHMWARALHSIQWQMRAKVNRATGHSPFYMVHGRVMKHVVDNRRHKPTVAENPHPTDDEIVTMDSVQWSDEQIDDYMKQMDALRERIYKLSLENIHKEQKSYKNYWDKKHARPLVLKKGALVMVENVRNKTRKGGKLDDNFKGPFVIAAVHKGQVYTLETMDGLRLANKSPAEHLKVIPPRIDDIDYYLHKNTVSARAKIVEEEERSEQGYKPPELCDSSDEDGEDEDGGDVVSQETLSQESQESLSQECDPAQSQESATSNVSNTTDEEADDEDLNEAAPNTSGIMECAAPSLRNLSQPAPRSPSERQRPPIPAPRLHKFRPVPAPRRIPPKNGTEFITASQLLHNSSPDSPGGQNTENFTTPPLLRGSLPPVKLADLFTLPRTDIKKDPAADPRTHIKKPAGRRTLGPKVNMPKKNKQQPPLSPTMRHFQNSTTRGRLIAAKVKAFRKGDTFRDSDFSPDPDKRKEEVQELINFGRLKSKHDDLVEDDFFTDEDKKFVTVRKKKVDQGDEEDDFFLPDLDEEDHAAPKMKSRFGRVRKPKAPYTPEQVKRPASKISSFFKPEPEKKKVKLLTADEVISEVWSAKDQKIAAEMRHRHRQNGPEMEEAKEPVEESSIVCKTLEEDEDADLSSFKDFPVDKQDAPVDKEDKENKRSNIKSKVGQAARNVQFADEPEVRVFENQTLEEEPDIVFLKKHRENVAQGIITKDVPGEVPIFRTMYLHQRKTVWERLGLPWQHDWKFNDFEYQGVNEKVRPCAPKTVQHTPGDGNCFFSAVAWILTGDYRGAASLRDVLCDFIANPKNLPSISTYLVDKCRSGTQYLHRSRMRRNAVWATEVEIHAMAVLLGLDMWVYLDPRSKERNGRWTVCRASGTAARPSKNALFLWNDEKLHYAPILEP